jgi:hypothetical protein
LPFAVISTASRFYDAGQADKLNSALKVMNAVPGITKRRNVDVGQIRQEAFF